MSEVKENEKEVEETKEENVEVSMKDSYKKKIAKAEEETKKAKDDAEHWKNEYYKLYADMDNLRKDIKKDHNEAMKYRIEGFVSDLLQVLDSFEIALKNEPSNPETKNYLIGFNYVYTTLINILQNEGIEIISPSIDQKFDESVMQAVDHEEFDGEENLVKKVNLKGYKLHSHLIRPAMVVVSKKKSEEVKKEEDKAE